MSKTEILTELPKLTPEERQEVRELLAEIDGTDWLDDGELTDEEKALIDARLMNASAIRAASSRGMRPKPGSALVSRNEVHR